MRKRSTFMRTAGAAASAAALALAIAGPARADDSTVVPVVPCAVESGAVTVPAGGVTLHLGGFAEGTLGLINTVLAAQTTTLAVGDTDYDLSGLWSARVEGDGFWAIFQPDRDLGTLAPGQSVTVSYDISFSHPVSVLFPPFGPGGITGPFVITGEGPFDCTITAA